VDQLPDFGEPLDLVFSVNSLGFWTDPVARLQELRRLLRPGGRIALVSQPRFPGVTTAHAAQELEDRLTQAGFTQIRLETLALEPPVACVQGVNPA
jgi:SAM-dependent methyltransferase